MYPNLELEMFKRKITNRDLARELHISESTMRNKRKGRADLTLTEVERILDIFPDVPWRELFAREDEQGRAG
ncbi:helix-turn-helix domain-containing protein [Agathobaculum desmolans]|uniref:helix-turn-helix domain-containing protein n=1 Tax=Agathobaculum desmolans TaxID=39484 RepID=UPI0004E210BA|nr:helix-turn-helix transcriptional regulator [Agathobaculum desmolans]